MDTLRTPIPQDSFANFAPPPPPPSSPQSVITPDNPPWGIPTAMGFVLLSFVLLFVLQLGFVVGYLVYRGVSLNEWAVFITKDPPTIFVAIVSTIPTHLLTLGFAWLIVTKRGKHPFLQTLGWDWSPGPLFWLGYTGLAIVLLCLGIGIIKLLGNPQTELDRLIESSRATALATAFLAMVTAPFVEEVIYRGVLYSPLQRAIGKTWAVTTVMLLFAAIHIPQYWPSFGVITTIILLSFTLTTIRALTGKLLPCVVVHTIFNGIQSFLIVIEPYIKRPLPETTPAPALLLTVAHFLTQRLW